MKWTQFIEKIRSGLDQVPLPVLIFTDISMFIIGVIDVLTPDPGTLITFPVGASIFYLYNRYILRRIYGAVSPTRILQGRSPEQKARLGLMPYEDKLEKIYHAIKDLTKTLRQSEMPMVEEEQRRLSNIHKGVKSVEERLDALDKVLTSRHYNAANVGTEIARLSGLIAAAPEEATRHEYESALNHAKEVRANIEVIRTRRNQMVARLENFHYMLEHTQSQVLAMLVMPGAESREITHMFEELLGSVENLNQSINEIDAASPAGKIALIKQEARQRMAAEEQEEKRKKAEMQAQVKKEL